MECRHCHSSDPRLIEQFRINKGGITRLYCKQCRRITTNFAAPKILLFDIEVSRGIYKLYNPGKQTVGLKDVEARAFMLGWCAKWLFDDKVYSSFVTRQEAKNRDDYNVVKRLYPLISKADLVIAHNGDKYDIRKINWFFSLYNFQPNNRYITLDTYKKSKELFGAESCSLGYLLKMYGFNGKGVMYSEDWEDIETGRVSAKVKAEPYCRDDVLGLEDLYLKIRPWIRHHPNMSIYYEMYHPLEEEESYCPRCLHVLGDMRWDKQYRTPNGTIYASANCPHCGSVLRKCKKYVK